MPDQPHDIEPALRDQRAAGLDRSLLNRLEAAADGSLLELTTLEIQFEAELRNIKPSPLTASTIDSLEKAAGALPFPTTHTVVPFKTQTAPRPSMNRAWWSAAAAVAILGALGALMVPNTVTNQGPKVVAMPPDNRGQTSDSTPPVSAGVLPASYSRTVHETSDQGIYWPSDGAPHRVVKVVYMQQITLEREDGSTYQYEQPMEEIYLVPTESN